MALEPNLPTPAPESAAQSSPPDPTSVRTYAATAAAIVNSKLSLAALKLWATANPHRNLILHAAASGAKKMTEIHDSGAATRTIGTIWYTTCLPCERRTARGW